MRNFLGFGGFLLFAAGVSALSCAGEKPTSFSCQPGDQLTARGCTTPTQIRVNSVGYLPLRIKRGSYQGTTATFELRRAEDDSVAYTGKSSGPIESTDTDTSPYIADFTSVVEEGEYYLKSGSLRSPTFSIGPATIEDALEVSFLGLYGQRCGEQVTINYKGQQWGHGPCHLQEASLERVGGGKKDDSGGWHDAGDYGKYVVNGAFALGLLLKAYELFPEKAAAQKLKIPEANDEIPDLLNEAKVELSWLLKAQLDSGGFSHKVTPKNFSNDAAQPSLDKSERFFIEEGSAATGVAVGALALGARLFAPFDSEYSQTLLSAAKTGQKWLEQNPEKVTPDQSGFSTGPYTTGDQDDRAWALIELWETTGEADYRLRFERRYQEAAGSSWSQVRQNFDWSDLGNLALGTYLLSKRSERNQLILDEISRGFVDAADQLTEHARNAAYGRNFENYYWGINGVLARTAYVLDVAYEVQANPDYLDATAQQVDYLLGRNAFGRSFLTGIGHDPAYRPHHRPSTGDGIVAPWPGLLVGGAHDFSGGGIESQLPATVQRLQGKPEGLWWDDDEKNWAHNEVAINWNTAMSYALMSLLAHQEVSSVDCAPECFDKKEAALAAGAGGATAQEQ